MLIICLLGNQLPAQSFSCTDSSEASMQFTSGKTIEELSHWAYNNQYYAFSIDSVDEKNNNYCIYFGNKYSKLTHIKFNDSTVVESNLIDISDMILEQINEANEKGHPFAHARVTEHKDTLSVNINPGDLFYLDSLNVTANIISTKYLLQVLNMKTGELYKHSKIQSIPNLIKQVPYIRLNGSPKVFFRSGKYVIELDLVKSNSNQFNGFLGLIPDQSTPEIIKYRVNGKVNFDLINTLKQGERLIFKWDRLTDGSQNLEISPSISYISGSPYGSSANLTINKRDTSFLNVAYSLAGEFKPSFNQSFLAYYQNKSSSPLIESNHLNSSKASFYGVKYIYKKTDDPFVPMKGIIIDSDISIGTRSLNNDEFLEYEIQSDNLVSTINIPSQSLIGRVSFSSEKFSLIKQRSVIYNRIQLMHIENQYLFENELNFIGGINSIRGIDDKSELVSSYLIFTNEYRFHLERYTYLTAFFDYSFIRRDQVNLYNQKHIFSTGAGLNFSSKAGVFSIYYALSRTNTNPFYFRDAKIHLGYTSRF